MIVQSANKSDDIGSGLLVQPSSSRQGGILIQVICRNLAPEFSGNRNTGLKQIPATKQHALIDSNPDTGALILPVGDLICESLVSKLPGSFDEKMLY